MITDGSEPAGVAGAGTPDVEGMLRSLRSFLRAAGLPEAADGDAPGRAAEAWCSHLLSGYGRDPVATLRPGWADRSGHLVALDGIAFVSVCEHHLLPFFGRAYVAYLPDGEITGLSRIEEAVLCLSRRLQVQERLGDEIARALTEAVSARGAACVLEAEHLCVFARGKARGTVTRTFAFTGVLAADRELQQQCLAWMRMRSADTRERQSAET